MKIKHKGKIHPSPSSPSSSSSSSDPSDVLRLLPTAILTLASVLSVEDREVLAYLITRSMASSIFLEPSKKKKPPSSSSKKKPLPHNPPLSHCDCFDCYTSYWFRWDSSPNRELIHQVIDAFEDHLTNGENANKKSSGHHHRGKKKEKTTTRSALSIVPPLNTTMALQVSPPLDLTVDVNSGVAESQDNEAPPSISPDNVEVNEKLETEKEIDVAAPAEVAAEEEMTAAFSPMPASNHRGLARMVLPDVMGLLNSRLWNLWGPNV